MVSRNTAMRELSPEPIGPLAVARPRLPVAAAVTPYLERMDAARWYSNFGPLLTSFERRLSARFSDGAQVVTCVNATQGLTLALKALDLPTGSYCALPSYTFVATAHAVIEAGLVPWFLDVDVQSWMLTPEIVARSLPAAPGPVSAVVPVAAYGTIPDLKAWATLRKDMSLAVVIDAAAAFDQTVEAPVPVVVSLHATKVMGIGEGGYVATSDVALAQKLRQLTAFGFSDDRIAHLSATNAKLSEYAAAVGLAALDAWPSDRLRWMRTAQLLRAGLMHLPMVQFQPGWGTEWAGSVACVRLPDGALAKVEAICAEEQVQTRRWWNDGCHQAPAFETLPREPLPATHVLTQSIVGLPFSIDMDASDVNRIAHALGRAMGV